MKQKRPYKTYTREFKQEAVRLMETTDRPAAEVAMELGIRRNQLYKWKQQLAVKGEAAFTGGGRPKTENLSELALLKRENEQLRDEPRNRTGPHSAVRVRHRHEDFQSNSNFLNLIKTVTYALPVSICASK